MSSHNRFYWLALALIVSIGLLSGYYSYFINPSKYLIENDGVAGWEERMKLVKERIPPTIQEVGYISDNDSTASIQEYSLTRYSLVPIIVRQGGNYEWIVGNFTQAGFEEIIHNSITGPYEMEKLGAGIYLIHRTRP
jgi:hypothetical protein